MLTHLPIILSALAVTQVTDKLPNLDIARECRSEANDGSRQDLDHCITDETQARQQIQKDWASFAADDRPRCVQETAIAGDGSYVEMLTCLEMARHDRREADISQQQPRKPPSQ
jgi:hypothetical protein